MYKHVSQTYRVKIYVNICVITEHLFIYSFNIFTTYGTKTYIKKSDYQNTLIYSYIYI